MAARAGVNAPGRAQDHLSILANWLLSSCYALLLTLAVLGKGRIALVDLDHERARGELGVVHTNSWFPLPGSIRRPTAYQRAVHQRYCFWG
jgi:hypothetical protein